MAPTTTASFKVGTALKVVVHQTLLVLFVFREQAGTLFFLLPVAGFANAGKHRSQPKRSATLQTVARPVLEEVEDHWSLLQFFHPREQTGQIMADWTV